MLRAVLGALLLAVLLSSTTAGAQTLRLSREVVAENPRLDAEVPQLALALLKRREASMGPNVSVRALVEQIALELAAGQVDEAARSLGVVVQRADAPNPEREPGFAMLVLQVDAARRAKASRLAYAVAYGDAFRSYISTLSDRAAYEVVWALETPFPVVERNLRDAVQRAANSDSLTVAEATSLVRLHSRHRSLQALGEALPALLAADAARRYVTDTAIRIRSKDGATLSALVVRPRRTKDRLPTALEFDIYADLAVHLDDARYAASHGYAGVVVDARGKRLSTDSIRPFETEVGDTHAALDWIAAQPWSDGRVGMYGSSYGAFAGWAAAKQRHPALRTIAAFVAAMPGFGMPMENNVYLFANYAWPFYVGNNRTLDHAVNNDRSRWQTLSTRWYESGRAFREIDAVDGTPNPMMQRWLEHPTYDAYWQGMVPYGAEYAAIDIPVLTVTGYFDDGQISALEYTREHLRHRPNAKHYVVIGPYDHFSAPARRKAPALRGHVLDPVAQFNGSELTFAWFDHVFRGAPRPSLLQDRINHQVMGSNRWRHAPDFQSMGNTSLRLHLSSVRDGAHYRLTPTPRSSRDSLRRVVHLGDRSGQGNSYYPGEIVRSDMDFSGALTFVSEPLGDSVEVSGMMTGTLQVVSTARDFDYHVVLYELMPDGRLFHLSYMLSRASSAHDLATRRLLDTSVITHLPFGRSRVTSKRLAPGSRLLVVLDVNKDAFHQVNHGSGKTVSDEVAADAIQPLVLTILPGSVIEVPIRRD